MEPSHKPILALLRRYSEKLANDPGILSEMEVNKEKETIARFISFLNSSDQAFSRQNLFGHFCGSAWIVDKEFKRIVLTHHAKLGMWIQLGGHADDEPDLYQVALKEAKEESGLKNLEGLRDNGEGNIVPFDFSIHEIPANKDVGPHLHFDVTFVFVAEDDELVCSDESIDVRWFSFEEAFKISKPEMHYQLRKLRFFLDSLRHVA